MEQHFNTFFHQHFIIICISPLLFPCYFIPLLFFCFSRKTEVCSPLIFSAQNRGFSRKQRVEGLPIKWTNCEKKKKTTNQASKYKTMQEWDRMNAETGLRILHNWDGEENRETVWKKKNNESSQQIQNHAGMRPNERWDWPENSAQLRRGRKQGDWEKFEKSLESTGKHAR